MFLVLNSHKKTTIFAQKKRKVSKLPKVMYDPFYGFVRKDLLNVNLYIIAPKYVNVYREVS